MCAGSSCALARAGQGGYEYLVTGRDRDEAATVCSGCFGSPTLSDAAHAATELRGATFVCVFVRARRVRSGAYAPVTCVSVCRGPGRSASRCRTRTVARRLDKIKT